MPGSGSVAPSRGRDPGRRSSDHGCIQVWFRCVSGACTDLPRNETTSRCTGRGHRLLWWAEVFRQSFPTRSDRLPAGVMWGHRGPAPHGPTSTARARPPPPRGSALEDHLAHRAALVDDAERLAQARGVEVATTVVSVGRRRPVSTRVAPVAGPRPGEVVTDSCGGRSSEQVAPTGLQCRTGPVQGACP